MPFATRQASPDTQRPPVVRFELAPRTLLIIGCALAGLWLIAHLLPVLLVLVAALMLVGALSPLVESLERRRLGRNGAIALVFALGLGLAGLLLFLTVPTLVAQARSVVQHEQQIRDHLATYLDGVPVTHALADSLRNIHYEELLQNWKDPLLSASIRDVEIVAYSLAAVFLAIYIMLDRDRLRGALFSLVPRKHHVRTSRILLNLEIIVGGYIRGQVITCVLIGVFIFALLLVCHVPNALAIAVFGAAMDVLPYIGPLLTIVPAAAAAYAVGPWVAVTVLTALVLYEELESRLLIPVVYGRALRLPSSVVFFSLLVGGALGGIVGVLLALPIASALLMLMEELRVELPGEALQPAAAAERRKDQREEREYEERTEAAPAAEAAAVATEIARERKKEDGEAAAAVAAESKV